MPEHSDLLRNAIAIDQKLKAGKASVQPAIPKTLFNSDEDAFGGNDNNRRVAAKGEKAVEQKKEPVAETGAASASPVIAPVATVVAPQSKQGKAAAKVAAPVWNPNA